MCLELFAAPHSTQISKKRAFDVVLRFDALDLFVEPKAKCVVIAEDLAALALTTAGPCLYFSQVLQQLLLAKQSSKPFELTPLVSILPVELRVCFLPPQQRGSQKRGRAVNGWSIPSVRLKFEGIDVSVHPVQVELFIQWTCT